MILRHWSTRWLVFSLLILFAAGFAAGAFYEHQILETRFEAERLIVSRLRFEDWVTFTKHLVQDRQHPERSPLDVTENHDLSKPILKPPKESPVAHHAKPGCE